MISDHIDNSAFDITDYEWKYVDSHSIRIRNSLRKLFVAVDIDCDPSNKVLSQQIALAKVQLAKGELLTAVDQRLLLKMDRPYLMGDDSINPKRFEYYLYQRLVQKLDNCEIFVTDSERNRSLEDDLISLKDWKYKETFVQKTGLMLAQEPIQHTLTEKLSLLDQRLREVCNNIAGGNNPYITMGEGNELLKWSIANPRWKEPIDNPIYNRIQHMGIVELITYVNCKTKFLDAFVNISPTKCKSTLKQEDIIACIIANGTNYGLYKMANISDRQFGVLRHVNDSYIRLETTGEANDRISNATAKLPMFQHYNIEHQNQHASIDGQKFECRINTFKTRYSAKYFKHGKGISAMTLVSNHVPVNTRIIGANEHEGHFAFDLLFNNTSDILPNVLSTDSHGSNQVNFALLDLFGYSFAPRYANVKKVFLEHFVINIKEEFFLQLKKPINTELIFQEWDAIQRIICSLSRKTTTQSTIVKKLSNRKKANKTLRALHEYDRLVKCQYLLEYVDNRTLRHYVQQALNRGEAYHQLRRAIGSVNGNRFRGGNDYQVEQWNDCARLICNCIVYYNTSLLSVLKKNFNDRGDQNTVNLIAGLSPLAWQHINLNGRYLFGENVDRLEVDLAGMLDNFDPFVDSELGVIQSALAT